MYILELNLVLFFLLFDFHKNIMVFYFTNWTKDLYACVYFYQASGKKNSSYQILIVAYLEKVQILDSFIE